MDEIELLYKHRKECIDASVGFCFYCGHVCWKCQYREINRDLASMTIKAKEYLKKEQEKVEDDVSTEEDLTLYEDDLLFEIDI